ncbi:hypothetical protein B5F28_06585 [Gemmiger sp. An194]|nr:hypothetical protein B5F28_06585 [Gemmiger sp. An194]
MRIEVGVIDLWVGSSGKKSGKALITDAGSQLGELRPQCAVRLQLLQEKSIIPGGKEAQNGLQLFSAVFWWDQIVLTYHGFEKGEDGMIQLLQKDGRGLAAQQNAQRMLVFLQKLEKQLTDRTRVRRDSFYLLHQAAELFHHAILQCICQRINVLIMIVKGGPIAGAEAA